MKWDTLKKMNLASEKINDQSIYNGEEFSKLLIFISGNLDEAYRMANDVHDVDTDADILHEHSKKINFLKCIHLRQSIANYLDISLDLDYALERIKEFHS
jgi:predicted nucleotidyltransferase